MARQAGGDLQVEWLDDPTSALSGWCLPDYAPAHRLPQLCCGRCRACLDRTPRIPEELRRAPQASPSHADLRHRRGASFGTSL